MAGRLESAEEQQSLISSALVDLRASWQCGAERRHPLSLEIARSSPPTVSVVSHSSKDPQLQKKRTVLRITRPTGMTLF